MYQVEQREKWKFRQWLINWRQSVSSLLWLSIFLTAMACWTAINISPLWTHKIEIYLGKSFRRFDRWCYIINIIILYLYYCDYLIKFDFKYSCFDQNPGQNAKFGAFGDSQLKLLRPIIVSNWDELAKLFSCQVVWYIWARKCQKIQNDDWYQPAEYNWIFCL